MTSKGSMQRISWSRILLGLLVAGAAGALGWGLSVESQSSPLQSRLFTRLTEGFAFSLESGKSPAIRFPDGGPYDLRLGYARIPQFVRSLEAHGFAIDRQARLSQGLVSFVDWGGFPVYREKSQAGLSILDASGQEIYRARHPERVFATFDDIAPAMVAALLFVENRELLDLSVPTRNPAVEWDRFAAASANALLNADRHWPPRSRSSATRRTDAQAQPPTSSARSCPPARGPIRTAPTPPRRASASCSIT
jgi:hypothetical protein